MPKNAGCTSSRVTRRVAVLAAAVDALRDCTQACDADVDGDLREVNVTEMIKLHPALFELR